MIVPVLAVLGSLLGAAGAQDALPREFLPELARIEALGKRAVSFRRLIAETDGVPKAPGPLEAPAFIEYHRVQRRLIFDVDRALNADEALFQVALARQLARASMALPIELVEAELAAWQRLMEFALELARLDPSFSKMLKAKVAQAQDRAGALRTLESWARARLGPQFRPEPPDRLPPGEIDRLAVFMALLIEGPERWYAAAERLLSWTPEAALLTEVEDILERYGPQVADARLVVDEAYVRLDGRRYPAAAVGAAKVMAPLGGAKKLREVLGNFETDSAELSQRLAQWLRRSD